MIQLELPGFLPDEFSLKTRDDVIILEANHEAKTDLGQEFTERFAVTFSPLPSLFPLQWMQ